jgi:outer membrane protein assembly factor BamB
MKYLLAIVALGMASYPSVARAEDWMHWRGPAFNGSSPEKGLPVEFGPEKGVKWSVPLPGPSASTPVIAGPNVFVSSTDLPKQSLVALCYDRATGKLNWRREIGDGYQTAGQGNKLQLDDNSNYASPSPVTDGKLVVFFYGNGELAAFNVDGSPLWARNIQKDFGDFAYQWTISTSPTIWEGRMFLQVLQRDQPANARGKGGDSFLLAVDPKTGKDLWKVVRPSDAKMESREAYSTPIPYTGNGRKELLITGGDVVSGHDPATGKELWRWGTWNTSHREVWWRLVPSPVVAGNVVLASAPKGAPVYAAKLGGNGDLGEAGLVWKSEDRGVVSSDVPTPAAMGDKFIVVNDRKKSVSSVNAADGKIVWTAAIQSMEQIWGSPTVADDKIYLLSKKGEVIVLKASDGRTLAYNPMADGETEIRSSIAISNKCLFIRTNTKLYCVGS